MPRRFQFVLAFIGCTIGTVLMGPTFMPDKLIIVCAGMGILGVVQTLSMIPSLPEAIDQTTVRFRIVHGVDESLDSAINDTLSCLYTIVYCASSLVSPIVGGKLFDMYGYKATTQIIAIAMVAITAIYLVFNCGFSVFEKHKQHVEVL